MGKMPAHTLRLGAIGLGRAAATMLPSLIAHPNVRLTAAADLNPEARARFEADFGGRTYATAAELCASSDVDAVYIATPHQYHAADVLTAAGNGKHAIVEKPMALTVEECRAMTDAAESNGVVLVVGHSAGFNPADQADPRADRKRRAGALRHDDQPRLHELLLPAAAAGRTRHRARRRDHLQPGAAPARHRSA